MVLFGWIGVLQAVVYSSSLCVECLWRMEYEAAKANG
jgi:hypothetical protein